jgi:hypothetical protein
MPRGKSPAQQPAHEKLGRVVGTVKQVQYLRRPLKLPNVPVMRVTGRRPGQGSRLPSVVEWISFGRLHRPDNMTGNVNICLAVVYDTTAKVFSFCNSIQEIPDATSDL